MILNERHNKIHSSKMDEIVVKINDLRAVSGRKDHRIMQISPPQPSLIIR